MSKSYTLSVVMRLFGRSLQFLVAAFGLSTAGQSQVMSFEEARAAMGRSAEGGQASEASVRAAEHQAAALRTLYRPTVIASASAIAYQKTLAVDLTGPKERFVGDANQFLNNLPQDFPAPFSSIAAIVAGRIEQALPGLLDPIPDELQYRANATVIRPNVTAVLPLYTGGAIAAVRDAARANVSIARGTAQVSRSGDAVRLAQSYFGQQVAAILDRSASVTLAANQRHVSNSEAMERAGILPNVAVLEVKVLRDASQRNLDRARREKDLAQLALARMTGVASPALSTPLFVNRHLPPRADFLAAASQRGNGQTTLAKGNVDLSAAAEKLARSTMKPKAFAFGSYNLARKDALPIDPDWVVGVTVSMTLVSPVNRRELVAAAEARREAAVARERNAADRVQGEIERSYALAQGAQQSFLSMDSSIVAARENLRVQDIAFREGEGTAARVVQAQSLLAAAESERATAAYEYVVALSALLAASGQEDSFSRYATRADRIIVQ